MRSALGNIYKDENGVYTVSVELPRDSRTGKRRRLVKTVRGSLKDAERARAKLLTDVGRGDVVCDVIEMKEFWEDHYLPYANKRLRAGTVFGYTKKYKQYIEPRFGNMLLSQIEPIVIDRWLDDLGTDTKRFEAFKMLRQLLSRAVRWNLLTSNPCDRVEVPNKPTYRPEVLTAEEVRIYLEHFRDSPVEAGVLIALGGGLRRSEIVALDWEDITSDGIVTVDNAITSIGGEAKDDKPKTEFSNRRVHLPKFVTKRLNELRSKGPILQNSKGERMHPEKFSHLYAQRRNTLPEGVKRIPLKNLRHTSLTMAIESGVDLLAVSRRAGHSNVSITSAYYVRPHERVDAAAADAMDAFLGA